MPVIPLRLASVVLLDGRPPAPAQAPPAAPAGRGVQAPQPPAFVSPDVSADRRITFRLHAPDATSVTLRGGDIPAAARATTPFTKGANGVWATTPGPR